MSIKEPDPRIMNACPTCGGVMDVTACAPYSKVVCPSCSTPIRVRTDFDHFTLRKQIGEGGMSRVFLALDRTLNRETALKILNAELSKEKERIEQFEREARITASISHPNVVKVFSVGNDQGHFFIAMELVPSGSLDEMIARLRRVPEAAVLEMAEQLSLGLKAAFDAGLIHRDVKPGNILFSHDGTAKVVDFGLALVIDQVDENKEIWATPYYVPPEKLHKKPEDFRSDIYSLGASLFHALAGKPPYSADTASLEELKAIKDKPVSLELFAPHVSSETCALIDRMMARKPNDRYKDYKELIEHIRYAKQACQEVVDPAIVARRTQRAAKQSAARNATIVVFAVALLMIGAVLANHFLQRSKRQWEQDDPAVPPPFAPATNTTKKFVGAREAMLANEFAKANAAFLELARSPETKQPTLNWARFNAGLCALFLGEPRSAALEFQRIVDYGPFETPGGEQAALAEFFVDVARTMSHPLPVPLAASLRIPSDTSESLALLAFGLKDWEAGYYSEAGEFFELFRNTTPSSSEKWVDDYKGLLDKYVDDAKLLEEFPSVRREPSLDQMQGDVEKAKAIVRQLRSSESVKKRLSTRIKRMAKLLARLEREDEISERARLAALQTGERKRLLDLRKALLAHVDLYRFPEALELLGAETFIHPEIKLAYEDQRYLYETAEKFLNTLVADIKKYGYTGSIPRVNSTPLLGTITGATRDSLAVQIGPSAKSTIPISLVPASKLIGIAKGYLLKDAEMSAYHPRVEQLVAFAYLVGITDADLEKLGSDFRKEQPDLRPRWTRILESDPGP